MATHQSPPRGLQVLGRQRALGEARRAAASAPAGREHPLEHRGGVPAGVLGGSHHDHRRARHDPDEHRFRQRGDGLSQTAQAFRRTLLDPYQHLSESLAVGRDSGEQLRGAVAVQLGLRCPTGRRGLLELRPLRLHQRGQLLGPCGV